MTKEDDEQVKDDVIPGKEDVQEQEPPKDVRGAIRAAIKETSEEQDEDVEPEPKDKEPKEKRARTRQDTSERTEEDESKEDDKEKEQKEPKKEEVEASGPWKNKYKQTWDKLSPEDKKIILEREKEVSDGFAQVSQRLKTTEDIERAIAPRLQYIQQYGVSPGVVVDRLFQWMEGINNPQTKVNTFKELARSFGVDLNQLVSQPNSQTENNSEPDPDNPPEWFNQFTGKVDQEIGTLKQTISSQQEAAAQSYISNWAKDKPHYAKVSQLMGQLMGSGAVTPLVNGVVNLDGAYEAAIKLHPEVGALIQQEALEKATKEASDKALKEAKDKSDKLAKAKKAGVGLKPAAPSMPSSGTRPNGKGKEDTSVRSSIRAAMESLRD